MHHDGVLVLVDLLAGWAIVPSACLVMQIHKMPLKPLPRFQMCSAARTNDTGLSWDHVGGEQRVQIII